MTRKLFLFGVLLISVFVLIPSVAAVLVEDFDPGLEPGLWEELYNASVDDNRCGSVSGNALTFNGDVDENELRYAITTPQDVSGGGSLRFYAIIPPEEFDTPDGFCDDADDGGEGILVSYSVNGGSTWIDFAYVPEGSFQTFTQVSIALPAGAQTSATQFRFLQGENSGPEDDNVAIDNLEIPTGGSGETVDGVVVGPPCNNLFDGRINDNQSLDCAAPVAIYLVGGRIDVYAIDPNNGEGALVISAPTTLDDTTPDGTAEASGNILLGSSGNIRLYWLPATNEYLLRATYSDGKVYEVIWSGDGTDLRHTSA